jgi:hypothetical protein
MKNVHQTPIMRVLIGGIATGLFALFALLAIGYLFSNSGTFEAVTATIGVALAAGILAGYEFHAFAR